MLEYLRYQRQLKELFRAKESIRLNRIVETKSARAKKASVDDLEALDASYWFEEKMVNEEIAILVTNSLTSKAARKFVNIPSRDDVGMWEQCDQMSRRFVLSPAGISKLRSDLRSEAREQYHFLFQVLAALTGIIGALTGLIAVVFMG